MTPQQREELLCALRHGRDDDDELEALLIDDVAALEPLIDKWIAQAELEAVRTDGFLAIQRRLLAIENHLLEKLGEAP